MLVIDISQIPPEGVDVDEPLDERKLHLDATATLPARAQDVTLTPGRPSLSARVFVRPAR